MSLLSDTIRRAVAAVLFGIVAIMAVKSLLDPHADHLTAALVFATAVSGWFVAETVVSMEVARRATFRPVLVPHVQAAPGHAGAVLWGVRNVGQGPALDVNVTLAWAEGLVFELRRPVLAAGDSSFVTDPQRNEPSLAFEPLRQTHPVLSLTGSCRDVAGTHHEVNLTAPFADEWRRDAPLGIRHVTVREALDAQEAGRQRNQGDPE
jgi:hypothetical protein